MPAITIDASPIGTAVAPVPAAEPDPARPVLCHNGPETITVPVGDLRFAVGPYATADVVVHVAHHGVVTYGGDATACLSGSGTSADPLRLNGFPVTVDASALSHGVFIAGAAEIEIFGPAGSGELRLLPARWYVLQVASGDMSGVAFAVGADGTVEPARGCEGFLHLDENALVLDGYDVTWDLRDLSHGVGSYIVGAASDGTMDYPLTVEAGKVASWRMLPVADLAIAHEGAAPDCLVQLTNDGTFSYGPDQQSYLDGAGTATLRFLGHPVVVDARELGRIGAVPGARHAADVPELPTGKRAALPQLVHDRDHGRRPGSGLPGAAQRSVEVQPVLAGATLVEAPRVTVGPMP